MDRLDTLKLFVRIADSGQFSKAAQEAGTSQPAASRAIADLEQRWGVKLFSRTTRSLALTEAGQRACERARILLAEHEMLEAEVRDTQDPVGLLRVGGSVAFLSDVIAPMVPDFLERFPLIKLDLQARDERTDLIRSGTDLAFRLGNLENSSLTSRRIGSFQRILVASPGLAGALGALSDPRALEAFPWISFAALAPMRGWKLHSKAGTLVIVPRSRVQVSSGPLARRLALEGVGVLLAPEFLFTETLTKGDLVQVLPDWQGEPLDLHAIWPGRVLPHKARVFLEFVHSRVEATR